jgi:hypothetical protein
MIKRTRICVRRQPAQFRTTQLALGSRRACVPVAAAERWRNATLTDSCRPLEFRNGVASCAENKTAAYLYAAVRFLVEPWGIEPQTSRDYCRPEQIREVSGAIRSARRNVRRRICGTVQGPVIGTVAGRAVIENIGLSAVAGITKTSTTAFGVREEKRSNGLGFRG